MHTFDFIRHAESTWSAQAPTLAVPHFGGRMTDIDLTPTGEAQAAQLGRYAHEQLIAPIGVFCSPARRAMRTHHLSAAHMNPSVPLVTDDRLQEMDWGGWTNQPRSIRDEPATRRTRAQLGYHFSPPGGESIYTVRCRMHALLMDVTVNYPDGHYWFHSHRNAIKALVAPFFRWTADELLDQDLGPASLTRIIVKNGRQGLLFFNESPS